MIREPVNFERTGIPDTFKNLLSYNAWDSSNTFAIMESFWQELYTDGHEHTYNQTIALLQPLMFMMTRGIAVNQAKLKLASINTEKEIDNKQLELERVVGRSLNPLSPKQVGAYFYIDQGIQPYLNQEGRPTTDDKAMARLARGTASRPGLRAAKLIQELRGLHKLKGTYLDIAFDSDGRFRTSCNPRGTKFGRISTGKTIYQTGMNMQNLPDAFKQFLVPDEGYIMFEVDKRQAEWVVVAFVSGDEGMMQVLREGGDPHVHTGWLMTGADKDLIKKEAKAVGHSTDPVEIEARRRDLCPEIYTVGLGYIPRNFSIRQGGKKGNHALNYGETPKRFAIENEIQEKEAKLVHTLYHRAYPGIARWHSHVQERLSKDRTLTNCFGRKCRFLERWGDDLFKQAYAFEPQSTVADVINNALIEIYNDNDERLLNLELLAQVHDSILFQLPMSMSTEDMLYCLRRVNEATDKPMECYGREFRIATDLKMGTDNWADLHEYDFTNQEQFRVAIDGFKETQRLANGVS